MPPLFPFELAFQPAATIAALRPLTEPDPACCNACATFRAVLAEGRLPGPLWDFLALAGIDPAKPIEVWGAPDGGFLAGWWVFVAAWPGQIPPEAQRVAQLAEGLTCTVSDQVSLALPASFLGQPVLQLEFTWTSERLKELERGAWPPHPGVASN